VPHSVRRDYKVKFQCEQAIAETAFDWLVAHGTQNSGYFNITKFVRTTLSKGLLKGAPKIEYFEMSDGGDPAYVALDPFTLHIDREIWELADLGDPDARFILAHEIGHLILHDHQAKAFSNDPDAQIKFAMNEYSAEWQANTFAAHFLLPTHIVAALGCAQALVERCSVPRQLAEDRLWAVQRAKLRSIPCEGDACDECGNFTLVRDGGSMKCNVCGKTPRRS
jgi:IrrE N-terminal-like domain